MSGIAPLSPTKGEANRLNSQDTGVITQSYNEGAPAPLVLDDIVGMNPAMDQAVVMPVQPSQAAPLTMMPSTTLKDLIGEDLTGFPSLMTEFNSVSIDVAPAELRDPLGPTEANLWPTTISLSDLGRINELATKTSYEEPSKDIAKGVVTYAAGLEDEPGAGIYDTSFVAQGSTTNIANTIVRLLTSAVFTILTSLKYPVSTETNQTEIYQNDEVGVLFNRSRIVHTAKKNGHAELASLMLDPVPRDEYVAQKAPGVNEVMRLGIHDSTTIMGVRTAKNVALEVVKSMQAYIWSKMEALAFANRRDILDDLARSFRIPEGSVSVNAPFNYNGPQLIQDPYINETSVEVQQLILNASPRHQAQAMQLAKMITSKSGVEVSNVSVSKTRAELNGKGELGINLSMLIGEVPEDVLTQLLYCETAPHLFQIDVSSMSRALITGEEGLARIFDILALYTMLPVVAHKMDYILVPQLMSAMSRFEFSTAYFNSAQYSIGSINPQVRDSDFFYSTEGYPNILKPEHVVPENSPMRYLRDILYYNGNPIQVDRDWDPVGKVIHSAYPYMSASGGNQQLIGRIRLLQNLMKAISSDQNVKSMKKGIAQSLSNVANSITALTETVPRAWHYSAGYATKAIASSPCVNAPLQTFFGEEGANYKPPVIVRNGNDAPGRQTVIKIPQGLGVSLLFCGGSKHINPSGTMISSIHYTPDEALDMVIRHASMLIEGTRAGIAAMAVNTIAEYARSSVEVVAPLTPRNTREWVSPIQLSLSTGNPSVERPSQASEDAITNPIHQKQIDAVRPMPSALVATVLSVVDEVFPSHWFDFLTTTDSTHSASYFEGPPHYELRFAEDASFISPPVRFCEEIITELMSLNISRYLDVGDPENGIIRRMVLAWTRTATVDRFNNDPIFDWDAFITNASYTVGDPPVEYTYDRVWLVTSMNEDIGAVPPNVTHLGMLTTGGSATLQESVSIDPSTTMGLYTCTRERYVNNSRKEDWTLWNGETNVILIGSTSSLFDSGSQNHGKVATLKSLLQRGSSPNSYPGKFVYVDDYTLFEIIPSDAVNTGYSTTMNEEDAANFYFEQVGFAKVPPLFDGFYNIAGFTYVGGTGTRQLLRFAQTAKLRDRILAVRPAINDVDYVDQNTYNLRNYHIQIKSEPYWATVTPAGVTPGETTALIALNARIHKFVHSVPFVNVDVIRRFDKQAGGFSVEFMSGR